MFQKENEVREAKWHLEMLIGEAEQRMRYAQDDETEWTCVDGTVIPAFSKKSLHDSMPFFFSELRKMVKNIPE